VALVANSAGATTSVKSPLPGFPGLWCSGLDEHLAGLLIERTLDRDDVRLREMTHDLSRFSSSGQLERWRPGRDLVCLQDGESSLLGVFWIAEKRMPERRDYHDPELIRRCGPRITVAIRTYGEARGHGLAKAFAVYSLTHLFRDRPRPHGAWYETKAANAAVRRLSDAVGFSEVSGEEGGTVVGMRIS
jgi:hypothetical protein